MAAWLLVGLRSAKIPRLQVEDRKRVDVVYGALPLGGGYSSSL